MKLVIAVVNNQDVDTLSSELANKHFGATKLRSTGGFLKQGNTTFLIGVEDHRLNQAMALIRKTCGVRMEMSPPGTADEMSSLSIETSQEIVAGGATIWVVPMDQFVKL
jgi:uncharacterized protein YaaQ